MLRKTNHILTWFNTFHIDLLISPEKKVSKSQNDALKLLQIFSDVVKYYTIQLLLVCWQIKLLIDSSGQFVFAV